MDDLRDANIEEEIQKAECEVDCEMALIDCDIPELGTLAIHTGLCERTTPQFIKHARKHSRRR